MDRSHGCKPSAASLPFGADYPRRPPFFFAKAIRLMSHYAVAQDVGLLGYAILTEIVLTEDRRDYSSPPKFWQSSFQERFGRGKEAVSEAIQRCVDNGWLYWSQPNQRRPGVGWLLVPVWVEESITGRDWSEIPTNSLSNHPTNSLSNHPTNSLSNHLPSSSPSLPNPPSPSHCKEAGGWEVVENEMLNQGIGSPAEPLRSLQATRCPVSLALGVLRHASEAQLWSPGRVRRRLLNLRPGQDPCDRHLWMQPDRGPARPVASPVAAADARARESRLRQLEMEFEPILQGFANLGEVIARYQPPELIAARLRPYSTQRWSRSLRANDETRLALLDFLASVR